MFRFIIYRFGHYCYQSSLWFYGLIYLLMQSFVFMLLLQPLALLSNTQTIGVLWAVSSFTYFALIGQILTRKRLIWLVEAQQVSRYAMNIWFSDFIALWLVCVLIFLIALPAVSLLYGLRLWICLGVCVVWFVSSPVFLLQIYLARCLSFFMRSGLVLSLLCVVPWMIPGLLMAAQCFGQQVSFMQAARSLSLMVGANMCSAAVLYHVIGRVLPKCYHHLKLA